MAEMSRRDFLKWGAATVAVAGAALGGKKVVDTISSFSEQGSVPVFNSVEEGSAILLTVDGNRKQTIIEYAQNPIPLDHLEMRLVSGQSQTVPFENGSTKVRDLGEILDYTAVPLTLNTDLLPEGTDVHYVVTTGPVQTINPPERYPLDVSAQKGLFGIRVVTDYADGINDKANLPPMETNSRPLHAPSPKVGEGWAIGHFQQDGALKIKGFVQDARIFKPAGA